MSTAITSFIVFACVFGAALFGMWLRGKLPEHHLSSQTRDTVTLSMGFIATMSALILGLLVSSAKDYFDEQANGVTQMSAKVIFLDRILANFGSETKDVRATYRRVVEQAMQRMWPERGAGESQLDPTAEYGEGLFAAIESLKPTNELQTAMKTQATAMSLELGQLRWLEYEQSASSASKLMMRLLVFWIAVLFASFGLYAPRNSTAISALLLAAISVAGAMFLISELRTPFTGLLQIPQMSFQNAIAHLGK